MCIEEWRLWKRLLLTFPENFVKECSLSIVCWLCVLSWLFTVYYWLCIVSLPTNFIDSILWDIPAGWEMFERIWYNNSIPLAASFSFVKRRVGGNCGTYPSLSPRFSWSRPGRICPRQRRHTPTVWDREDPFCVQTFVGKHFWMSVLYEGTFVLKYQDIFVLCLKYSRCDRFQGWILYKRVSVRNEKQSALIVVNWCFQAEPGRQMSGCWREQGRSQRAEHVAWAELVLTGINPEPGINQTQVTAMQN